MVTIDLDPSEAISAFKRMRERFNKPALDMAALIGKVDRQLPQVGAVMDYCRADL